MLYEEYEIYKAKYYEAQKKYNNILNEKEELFSSTQPRATDYSKERVNGGSPVNAFDTYIIKKDEKMIDERLNEIRSILEDREKLLKSKEQELKASKHWHDIIYKYYYIDKLSTRKISARIPFSKSEISRKVAKISKNIKMGQNGTKNMK